MLSRCATLLLALPLLSATAVAQGTTPASQAETGFEREFWPSTNFTKDFLANMLNSKRPRLLLYPGDNTSASLVACVPNKNGITTIRGVFYALSHPNEERNKSLYENDLFNWVDRLPTEKAFELLTAPTDQVVRIALLRNPFERIVSAYVDKIVDREDWDYVAPWLEKNCNVTANKLTFDGFVKCIILMPLDDLDRHFTPQVDWCALRQLQYDHYLTTSSLESQLQAVLQAYNFSVTEVPQLNRALGAKRADWRDFYSPVSRKRVAQLYSEDFAFMHAMFNQTVDEYFWEGGGVPGPYRGGKMPMSSHRVAKLRNVRSAPSEMPPHGHRVWPLSAKILQRESTMAKHEHQKLRALLGKSADGVYLST